LAAKKKKSEDKDESKNESKDEDKGKETSDDKYTELEKKVGEMSKYINDTNEFIQGASVVINTLAYNPELREAFQNQLKKQQGVVGEGQQSGQQSQQSQTKTDTSGQTNGETDVVSKKVDEVAASQREQIVQGFEKEVGIDKLKDEERKEARRKLEGYLNEFGVSVKTNPLPSLRGNLEKAYFGTIGKDKLKEEGKLEGMVAARGNQQGTMGTISGGSPESQTEEEGLTDKQKAWAKKLGVDPEKAKKTYLSRDKEEKRVSESEKKSKK
jgi:hypothetical protein